MNEPVIEFSVGLVAHGKIQPGLLVNNAFIVGKCIKPGLSMICAHTALSEPAKSHLACGKVNDGVIDASAAEPAQGGYFLYSIFVGSE